MSDFESGSNLRVGTAFGVEFAQQVPLANRRFDFGVGRERSSSKSRSKYFDLSNPESATSLSNSTSLSRDIRSQITRVTQVYLQSILIDVKRPAVRAQAYALES